LHAYSPNSRVTLATLSRNVTAFDRCACGLERAGVARAPNGTTMLA